MFGIKIVRENEWDALCDRVADLESGFYVRRAVKTGDSPWGVTLRRVATLREVVEMILSNLKLEIAYFEAEAHTRLVEKKKESRRGR